MRFLLTTKAGAEAAAPPSPELMMALGRLMQEMAQSGALVQAGGMQSAARAAKLKLSSGKVTVTDGPFAEAKEVVGGYAIVDVKSREEALELARRFLQIHADILGSSYETESEVRQLFGGPEPGQGGKP